MNNLINQGKLNGLMTVNDGFRSDPVDYFGSKEILRRITCRTLILIIIASVQSSSSLNA